MNILLLSPWAPWPPFDGARIRILKTLRHLSRRHRVTLLTTIRRPEESQHLSRLNGACESITTTLVPDRTPAVLRRRLRGALRRMPLIQSFHYDPNLARHVHRLTSEHDYDIVHVEFSFMAAYLSAISSGSRAKRLLSMHNIETMRLDQELKLSPRGWRSAVILVDYLLCRSWEKRAVARFDGIATVSDSERAWVQQYAPAAAVEIVPNGVDTEYFCPTPATGRSPSLVFTGLMNHPPNVDAVVWFCEEILPIVQRRFPEVSFKIVGDKPDRKVLALAKRKGVQVTGRVPDVRPYLSECLAVVAPLRAGGGTRIKILEGMAMRRPVVSTRLGAEGLDVTEGVNILLGNTAGELANHIVSLLEQPRLVEELGAVGRTLVETKYDWRICLGKLERLYEGLAHRPTGAAVCSQTSVSSGSGPGLSPGQR